MRVKGAIWQAPRIVPISIPTNAAILTAPNVTAFISDGDYEVQSVTEVHETLGTDPGAVSVDVVKCTGTQTAAQGATMLASVFNLKATINTVVRKDQANGGLVQTTAKSKLQITKGDRIALKFAGTLTAITGVCITIILIPFRRKPSY